MKTFLTNLKYNVKRFFKNLYINSYGMDDLNKALLYSALALSIIDILLKSTIISSISTILFVLYLLRFFSKNKYKRSEENRWYRHKVKYFKLVKDSYKTHHIYECKKCGQYMRVPKKAGKIIVTCPNCGSQSEHKA